MEGGDNSRGSPTSQNSEDTEDYAPDPSEDDEREQLSDNTGKAQDSPSSQPPNSHSQATKEGTEEKLSSSPMETDEGHPSIADEDQVENTNPSKMSDQEIQEKIEEFAKIPPQGAVGKKDNPFKCEFCHVVFKTKREYGRHVYNHLVNKPFKCEHCYKSFIDKPRLTRHLKIHKDVRNLQCNVCPRTFKDPTSLRCHIRTHTNRKRAFKCQKCPKTFFDKQGLKRHDRSHTGERPFVCNLCGKAFMDKGSLHRHEKIHTGVGLYQCWRCTRTFSQKHSLQRHLTYVCGFGESPLEVLDRIDDEMSLPGAAITSEPLKEDMIKEEPLSSQSDEDVTEPEDVDMDAISETLKSKETTWTYIERAFVAPSIAQTSKDQKSGNSNCSPEKTQELEGLMNPGLAEIVNGIDSYEQMLSLCADKAQIQLDTALTVTKVPETNLPQVDTDLPETLVCFECGELLVDGKNFKMTPSSGSSKLKCLACCDEDAPVEQPSTVRSETSSETTRDSYNGDTESETSSVDVKVKSKQKSKSKRMNSVQKNKEKANIPFLSQSDNQYKPGKASMTRADVRGLEGKGVEGNKIAGLRYYPCNLCPKVFATIDFLNFHLQLHQSPKHCCEYCGKNFNFLHSLKRHVSIHTGLKPFTCPNCPKTFRDSSNRNKHQKACLYSFVLKQHQELTPIEGDWSPSQDLPEPESNTSNDNNPGSSDPGLPSNGGASNSFLSNNSSFANSSFGIKSELSESSINDTNGLDTSGLSQENTSAMIKDAEGSLNENPDNPEGFSDSEYKYFHLQCEICEKICDNQQTLKLHDNFHRGMKKRTCFDCGKNFPDITKLRRHMGVHEDKKNRLKPRPKTEVPKNPPSLYCDVCNKGFYKPNKLARHMSVHSQEKPYTCARCGKSYKDKSSLHRHLFVRGCALHRGGERLILPSVSSMNWVDPGERIQRSMEPGAAAAPGLIPPIEAIRAAVPSPATEEIPSSVPTPATEAIPSPIPIPVAEAIPSSETLDSSVSDLVPEMPPHDFAPVGEIISSPASIPTPASIPVPGNV